MLDPLLQDQLSKRLNRIEGQVRGIQKMLTDQRYCMDILTQTRSIASALKAVEDMIMENHLRTCVVQAFEQGREEDKNSKIQEIMGLVTQMRK